MKKMLSLLLCVLIILGIIAYAGVALAQNKPGYIPKAAAGNPEDFVRMTPQEQDEYLMTLGSEEEIQQALSLLSPEQLAALEEYRLSQPLPPGTDGQDPPAASETTQTPEEAPAASDETESPGADYAAMTPQELYEYLLTLGSEEEVAAVLNALTPEQYAALEAYALSVAEPEEAASPAVNYTNAAPFKEPVDIPGPMMAGQFAAQTLDTPNEEDALMLDKTVSGADGRYTLTIEAYATGEVTITTGDPLPTDIILVLDVSGSMNANMTDNVKCIDALKTAVNNFIDTVVGKATLQMNHRIAVVTFASASSIISGNGEASGAFVGAYNNASGISTLKNIIGDIKAGGSQGADSGLNNAISIFDSAPATGTRNRVVIYLAGGTPNGVELDPAIEDAYTLKTSCGATVYSVGVFDGADPTIPITDPDAKDDNKYMHFVSSNYPDATSMGSHGTGGNDGYYLSASNSTALNDIFNSIATRIGGTTVTLDETAVIKDMIAPYFQLPAGAVPSDIHVYTSAVNPDVDATERWQTPAAFTDAQVIISADRRSIGVSGFDYADNYYAAIETDGEIKGYQGKKLIIEIPIEYIEGSCFGGRVPTNKPVSGVYDDELLVEALPIPTVDIPVQYDFTALDQSIYLTQDAALDNLFQEAAGYVADGTNNAYVNIVYTVKTEGDVLLGIYTIPAGGADGEWNTTDLTLDGLTANTTYIVGCTVTPSNGPMDPAVVTKSATVYVWKPEVTWRDSTIYLGETADYEDNIIPVTWKNSSASAPAPSGAAPALTYQYTPAAASFATDTYVSVAVNIGSADITDYTSFVHQACSPMCGYDPALGQFMVHVKTCSLTVAKTGAADPTDTFIFTVTGGGLTLRVSVQGNGSQTITGLPVGAYTVTEDAGWSWRYTADHADVTLSAAHATDTVTISNDRTDDRWLSGDDHAVNTFPGAD